MSRNELLAFYRNKGSRNKVINHKCDKCKKTIGYNEKLYVEGELPRTEFKVTLCADCAKTEGKEVNGFVEPIKTRKRA